MVCVVTVQYPTAGGSETFDLDYYMKTHMPLVGKNWGQYGLKSWAVNKLSATPDGPNPPYNMEAILHFDSLESFQKAASSKDGEQVMGDIPNFSNQKPLIMIGEQVGSS
ncbi:MAG: hypothetical protein M1828_003393 [Chrysothrix sp. TS-e1954]|nr:MAG: hypothetical protein M1828_003393 [Chrysothrix sp. TS-e1954]